MNEAVQQWQKQRQHQLALQHPETNDLTRDISIVPQRSLSAGGIAASSTFSLLDLADLHAFVNKKGDRASSASRHRDAVKQSHSLLLSSSLAPKPQLTGVSTLGAGFRIPSVSNVAASLSAQEELALTLASSYRKDSLGHSNRSSLSIDLGDHHSNSSSSGVHNMQSSQSDANLIGGRRLVGVPKGGGGN